MKNVLVNFIFDESPQDLFANENSGFLMSLFSLFICAFDLSTLTPKVSKHCQPP